MADSDSRRVLIAKLNQIYGAYRSSLLNRKYYAHRLAQYQRWNRNMDIAIAVLTSSAVGSWAIWQIGWISPYWSAIVGAAAVLSIAKPLLQWPKEIERYSKLQKGYAVLYYDLNNLVEDIKMNGDVTPEAWAIFKTAQDTIRELAPDDDLEPIEHLRKKFTAEVNREKPLDMFWSPPKTKWSKEDSS